MLLIVKICFAAVLVETWYWKPRFLHLATISEIDTLFDEQFFGLHSTIPASGIFFPRKNAGCFGAGSLLASLYIINITSNMAGLSIGLSWTHKRPTWMHLKTWSVWFKSPKVGSINSKPLPSPHNSHARNNSKTCMNDKMFIDKISLVSLGTYISNKIEWPFRMVTTIILLTAHNLQQ